MRLNVRWLGALVGAGNGVGELFLRHAPAAHARVPPDPLACHFGILMDNWLLDRANADRRHAWCVLFRCENLAAFRPFPEYSRDNSYPWSPFPPKAGPPRTRSSQPASDIAGTPILKMKWCYK